MSSIDLYYLPISPPCRSVLLTAKSVGIQLNTKPVNILKGEQMKPEFLALNPEHTIPTMVDGDFVLWESRSICTYLASQYGKDNSLYPSDPKVRAKIDRLLFFDMGTLFNSLLEYVKGVVFGNDTSLDPAKLAKIHEALAFLDLTLKGHSWASGNQMTVADHVLVATVASMEALDVDLSKHSNVAAWMKKCQSEIPGYEEINGKPAKEYGALVKSMLK